MVQNFDFSGINILIAEDDETNFIFYREAFSRTNAKLIWASNGSQAVELFNSNQNIDLVIMDIQMPILDGCDALESIKKIKNVPVIVLTAYAMKSVKEKCIERDCSEFITKPVKTRELLEVVKRNLNL